MSDFEVVRSDVDGWDVRRVGEAQALSNYPTRELAEEAARRQQEAEHASGSDADPIDVRQDVHSEAPGEDLDVKRTLLSTGAIAAAVIVLIIVLAVIGAVTGFGS
jgi:hypothetical protein